MHAAPAPVAAGGRRGWTRPMRTATAAYMALLALVTVPTTIAFSTPEALARAIATAPQSKGLTADQVRQAANADAGVAITVTVVLGLCYAVVAVGALRGWSWAFWVAVVMLALEAMTALTGFNSLVHGSPTPQPAASLLANLGVAVLAFPILAWLLVGRVRGAGEGKGGRG